MFIEHIRHKSDNHLRMNDKNTQLKVKKILGQH
jgi:hypothetical protein